jgi:hypothetical protein
MILRLLDGVVYTDGYGQGCRKELRSSFQASDEPFGT